MLCVPDSKTTPLCYASLTESPAFAVSRYVCAVELPWPAACFDCHCAFFAHSPPNTEKLANCVVLPQGAVLAP